VRSQMHVQQGGFGNGLERATDTLGQHKGRAEGVCEYAAGNNNDVNCNNNNKIRPCIRA
jgi:hypothetical protein